MLSMVRKPAATIALSVSLGLLLPQVSAKELELEVMAPWDAEGKMYRTGPRQVQFLGEMEGIMYAEDSRGELDAALFVCPIRVELDEETDNKRVTGDCHIVAAAGNVFGRFQCEGTKGTCDGEFEITAGTDALEGATGGGAMTIRTVLTSTMKDATTGQAVTEATGLAIWPSLKVETPKPSQ